MATVQGHDRHDRPPVGDRRAPACEQRQVVGRQAPGQDRDDRERDRHVREALHLPAELLGVAKLVQPIGVGLRNRRRPRCFDGHALTSPCETPGQARAMSNRSADEALSSPKRCSLPVDVACLFPAMCDASAVGVEACRWSAGWSVRSPVPGATRALTRGVALRHGRPGLNGDVAPAVGPAGPDPHVMLAAPVDLAFEPLRERDHGSGFMMALERMSNAPGAAVLRSLLERLADHFGRCACARGAGLEPATTSSKGQPSPSTVCRAVR